MIQANQFVNVNLASTVDLCSIKLNEMGVWGLSVEKCLSRC